VNTKNNNEIAIDSKKYADDLMRLAELYATQIGMEQIEILPIAGAGSNRRYYRIERGELPALIGTCGVNQQENRAFVGLAHHFAQQRLAVPTVLAVSEDYSCYIQTCGGKESLFECLSEARITDQYTVEQVKLLEDAMRELAAVQYLGSQNLDFSLCYPCQAMNSRLVDWDLNYFKYCFLKPTGIEFDEALLQDEFDQLRAVIMDGEADWQTFMYRDFQSRNVMISSEGKLMLIDFQGGRRGPAVYDVASFLWQAKAHYPDSLKQHLVEVYIEAVSKIYPDFNVDEFNRQLPYFVLFRMLQTLGAYGFRGWIERKPHFLESVPMGADNLAALLNNTSAFCGGPLGQEFPVMQALSLQIRAIYGGEAVAAERAAYTHQLLAAENPLTVRVTSFSFKKGIPEDPSGNGGGFVFDCRAPHNPGRYEPYKKLTGLDKPVRDFLEADGEILPFIAQCKQIVSGSVERYLQRGFTNLCVNFGCTGGQHRSVYSADAIGRYLNDKYGVRVELLHREQDIAVMLPAKDVTVVFDSYLRSPQKKFNPESV
jgi:aminoglycoside/choline kinase family phosphotransferase